MPSNSEVIEKTLRELGAAGLSLSEPGHIPVIRHELVAALRAKEPDRHSRKYYRSKKAHLTDYNQGEEQENTLVEVVNFKSADLISSRTNHPSLHAPVIDLDYPAELISSKTAGHHHLLLQRWVSWEDYKKVLLALADADLIEAGYASSSIERGASYIRTAHTKK